MWNPGRVHAEAVCKLSRLSIAALHPPKSVLVSEETLWPDNPKPP